MRLELLPAFLAVVVALSEAAPTTISNSFSSATASSAALSTVAATLSIKGVQAALIGSSWVRALSACKVSQDCGSVSS